MSRFGVVPFEPPAYKGTMLLAPAFAEAVQAVLVDMPDAVIAESIRSEERQAWLFGFGRDYDDGRGVVTHAQTAQNGWHKFGLAVDIVHGKLGWDAGASWFEKLALCYEAHGLTAGARWRMRDLPHGQWGKCRPAPSDEARRLFAEGGNRAVWKAVNAL